LHRCHSLAGALLSVGTDTGVAPPCVPCHCAGFAPEANTSADLLYSFTDAAADMQVRVQSTLHRSLPV
jgi:hypothetical protein